MVEQNTSQLTETLDLLTHPYRRYVLYCLTNESTVISVEALAAAIAERVGDLTGSDRRTGSAVVETALRHTHLPKLADRGIVSFSPNTGLVELKETDTLDQFLIDMVRIDGYMQTAAGD